MRFFFLTFVFANILFALDCFKVTLHLALLTFPKFSNNLRSCKCSHTLHRKIYYVNNDRHFQEFRLSQKIKNCTTYMCMTTINISIPHKLHNT